MVNMLRGTLSHKIVLDIWYNKWAGGDREDSYSKYVQCMVVALRGVLTCYCI